MGGGGDWISFASTALSNFAAQYNFQSIAVCLMIMSASVCTADDGDCKTGDQLAWVDGSAEATIFIGAVAGQLSMGFLGDFLTRNQALTVTLALSALSAFLSAIAPDGNASTIYGVIIMFRFFLGVGLGGIYPLSATKSSEDSAQSSSGTNSSGSAAAFWWQIPGSVSPWLLGYIFTYTSLSTGFRWRLVLGLGAIPSALGIVFLWLESRKKVTLEQALPKMTEVCTNKISADVIMAKLRDPVIRNKLIGTGGSWLLFDIVFYGLTLIGGVIINDISDGDDDVSSDASIRNTASKQALALSIGAFSVIVTMILLRQQTMSLKYITINGFFVQGFFILLLLVLYTYLKQNNKGGLFALYCLVVGSLQFGVPVGTYALPASVFDKDIRCTFNGIAAACGKLGAIIGAYSFYYIAKASIHAVLVICVLVCVAGAYVTYAFILDADLMSDESSNRSLSKERANGEAGPVRSPLSTPTINHL